MNKLDDLITRLKLTGVTISKVDRSIHFHQIYFNHLDCQTMQQIGKVVEEFFYVKNGYKHLLPTFTAKDEGICLVIDSSLFNDRLSYLKEKLKVRKLKTKTKVSKVSAGIIPIQYYDEYASKSGFEKSGTMLDNLLKYINYLSKNKLYL